MKVLLMKDVYKLGRAGDIKRVADGFGRNYLIPQGLAVLATPGALKQSENIRARASVQRDAQNKEMSGVAEILSKTVIGFASKAGETGKLYGSITSQMIVDALNKKTGLTIERRQVDIEPIRVLGEHRAHVRLTADLNPEVRVIAHREGETPDALKEAAQPKPEAAAAAPETASEAAPEVAETEQAE